jgi:ectoine hydroxylase-related dioxygenase (phytanoyl-CoA dioxygenase family)
MPLTPDELKQYHEDGFLIIPDFFEEAELQPVINAIDAKVDRLAEKLKEQGKITDTFENEGFLTRLTKLEQASKGAATVLHSSGLLPDELATLWSSPKLLDVMEQNLGNEIAGHPVWNIRAKTPLNPLATVPWHQDTAYLAAGSESTFQPTAWIPLVDANSTNGAMQVIRGGHKHGGVLKHQLERELGKTDSWYLYVRDEDLPHGDIVTCEMKKGGVLLMNNLIPHRSTENHSDIIRWSIDLRWQRPNEVSGFDDVKPCILMRSASKPFHEIDWETWAKTSRQFKEREDGVIKAEEEFVFDSKVTGPWLDRWR